MAPIRTAIIGLASGDSSSWASNAHLPYLLSPRGRQKYQVVALLNSSIESAKAAISKYGLPDNTRAYGDPEALAEDKDIDLVVCSNRVDVHYKTILPSVKAGKSLYVEWPLAHNLARVRELSDAARSSGSSTMVGVQGRAIPVYVKIQDLIHQGRIGKVLSSEIRASNGDKNPDVYGPGLEYFTDKTIGGNVVTIQFGHMWDQIQYVLGDITKVTSHLQIQQPRIKIVNRETGLTQKFVTSDVPDLIQVTGRIASGSDTAVEGAVVSVRFQSRASFPGEPNLVWNITGERGEIRLTSVSALIQAFGYDKVIDIELHDFVSDTVEKVDWAWEDWQSNLPGPARGVGKLYDLFADGASPAPTFDEALKRHESIEALWEKGST